MTRGEAPSGEVEEKLFEQEAVAFVGGGRELLEAVDSERCQVQEARRGRVAVLTSTLVLVLLLLLVDTLLEKLQGELLVLPIFRVSASATQHGS